MALFMSPNQILEVGLQFNALPFRSLIFFPVRKSTLSPFFDERLQIIDRPSFAAADDLLKEPDPFLKEPVFFSTKTARLFLQVLCRKRSSL